MIITPDSTVEDLVSALSAERAAERQARIHAAKNNTDRLMAAGVLVTPDTAFDNAMEEQGVAAEALRRGIPVDVVRAEHVASILRASVICWLRDAAQRGETQEEHNARLSTTRAAVVAKLPFGRRCDHKRTAKSAGWVNKYGHYNMAFPDRELGGWTFVCTKCRTEVNVPKLTEPTEQAQLAAKLLLTAQESA